MMSAFVMRISGVWIWNSSVPSTPALVCQVRQLLEFSNKLRPAIGDIPSNQRRDADKQVGGPDHFSISQSQATKHGVPRWHIRDRNPLPDRRIVSIERHLDLVGKSAPAKLIEPYLRHDMPHDAKRFTNPPSRLQLEPMPLSIIDRKRVEFEPIVPRDRGRRC